jgi:transcriptional regulator with XRE-family HTH domain
MASVQVTPKELGRRLKQIREAAGLKQSELARRVTWSQAVLSRIESGDRDLSPDEIRAVLEAIGTVEARHLSDVVTREWRELPRPPLDHEDQDLLWEAEQVCRALVDLRGDPKIRHAFERRLSEYIDEIKHTADLILKREHPIAFIGSKGVGTSTAICKVTGLEVAAADEATVMPVLEAGGGGVTICDVHLRTGHDYGIRVDPCTEDEIRAHVLDFAEHMKGGKASGEDDPDDAAQGIAQEIERAIWNLAGFKIEREKRADGTTERRDQARELAARAPSVRAYAVDVLARMELHRRDRRDIWYDPNVGKPPLVWLKETFEQINNGRHPNFSLPSRIEVVVPQPLLRDIDLSVRFVDTRGVGVTAARPDLERHLDEPHTLAVLCSSFNDAPSPAAYQLLERAKQAGVRMLRQNSALLVLPRAGEARAVKDESGARAQTSEEGYDLKRESATMALEPIGLASLEVGFFNAFTDDRSRLRDLLVKCLVRIRRGFRARMEEDIQSARHLLANHEKEQVQEVLRAAGRMLQIGINQTRTVAPFAGHVYDSLLSQIRSAYAATVRATIRREGEWLYLSYGHHLAHGARSLAARAVEPLADKLRTASDLTEANPEFADAIDLIQQVRRVLDSALEDLLRKAQIMGQAVFKEALKLDPSLWGECSAEWGTGVPGYRDRVARLNQAWFASEPRQHLEQELFEMIVSEWGAVLSRLTSMLERDATTVVQGA